jgi:hypothetical protein
MQHPISPCLTLVHPLASSLSIRSLLSCTDIGTVLALRLCNKGMRDAVDEAEGNFALCCAPMLHMAMRFLKSAPLFAPQLKPLGCSLPPARGSPAI